MWLLKNKNNFYATFRASLRQKRETTTDPMQRIKKFKTTLFTLIAFITLVSMSAGAWQHLGTRTVNFGLDHDSILVTAKDGRFSKIKVNVSGNLNMHKVVVHYANGTRQNLSIRHNFKRGQDSRVIDLNGGKRIIRSIDLLYDTKNRARKKAKVFVYGRH